MRLVDADALKVKQQEDADLFINDSTISGKARRDEALNAVANIVNAPTIDPVKHGYWELSPFDGNWTCSECGNKPYHSNMKNMNYCPNCGAKLTRRPK